MIDNNNKHYNKLSSENGDGGNSSKTNNTAKLAYIGVTLDNLQEDYKTFSSEFEEFKNKVDSKTEAILENWNLIKEKIAIDALMIQNTENSINDLKKAIKNVDDDRKINSTNFWAQINRIDKELNKLAVSNAKKIGQWSVIGSAGISILIYVLKIILHNAGVNIP